MWRRLIALVALPHFLCAAAAVADITSASLEIQGAGLRLETVSVTTGLDIPTTVQTSFGNRTNDESPSVPGLLAVGDLTGPGIEIPIQLTTTPGYRFHIPGLTRLGDYYLQNVRLMNGTDVIQRAAPSLAKITVADLFQTSLAVKQLTPEEIRARGIVIDERNYDVYDYSLTFLVNGEQVVVPFPVIVDRRTHVITAVREEQDYGLPPAVKNVQPPRWTPPEIIPFEFPDLPSEGPSDPGTNPPEREIRPPRPRIPAALVIPNSLAVLHQFESGGRLLRQILHGGTGYDDPVVILIANDQGQPRKFLPIIDRSSGGSITAVAGGNGKLAERILYADAYGDAPRYLHGPVVDRIATSVSKDANGAITEVKVRVRVTEEIDAATLATGVRLAAVDESNTVVTTTMVPPTIGGGDRTIEWTLNAADWAALTLAPASHIEIAVTDALRAKLWDGPVMPLAAWQLDESGRASTASSPVIQREPMASIADGAGPGQTREQTLLAVSELYLLAAAESKTNLLMGFKAAPFVESANGAVYLRARWYDAETGSFLTPDPMEYQDSSNLYAFAKGDPVNGSDPSGMCEGACIGAIVGGLAGAGYAGYRSLWHGEDFAWRYIGQGAVAGAAIGFGIETLGAGSGLSAAVIGGTLTGAGFGGAVESVTTAGSWTGFAKGGTKGGALGAIAGATGYGIAAAGLSGGWAFAGSVAADTWAGAGIDAIAGDCNSWSGCVGWNAAFSLSGNSLGYGARWTMNRLRPTGPDVALGKSAFEQLLTFAEDTGSNSYHTWYRMGLVSEPVGEANFAKPFFQAASKARSIRFNLEGVNIEAALALEPRLARAVDPIRHSGIGGRSFITEWELRQILGNKALLGKTRFYWGSNVEFTADEALQMGLRYIGR